MRWRTSRRVLEKDPQNVDAWTKRGNILVALGETRQAIASYEQGAGDQARSQGSAQQPGLSARRYRPRRKMHSRDYDRVIEVNPNHVEAWINRGHVLLELHREEECLAAYRQAHALAPHHLGRETQRSHQSAASRRFQVRLGKLRGALFSQGATPIPRANIRCPLGPESRSTARYWCPASRDWAIRSCLQACFPISPRACVRSPSKSSHGSFRFLPARSPA